MERQTSVPRKSFQEKVSWFFTGYADTRAEKILYFIKRLVWIFTGNGFVALSLLIPAGISAAAAFLFFRFD